MTSSRRALLQSNLPVERGTFVGRVKLLDEIARRFDDDQRLVVLSGPEGIGKTRLALRSCALELPRFGSRGGVWCLDAAETRDARTLWADLAELFDVGPSPGAHLDSETTRLSEAVDARGPMLLLIDGVDALQAEALDVVHALLAQSRSLHVMLTTRQPRAADSAHVIRLSPLRVPKVGAEARAATVESVQLFVERASEARRGFVPATADLVAIAQIVRLLDGVPLAIEIAAARLRNLSAADLLERLPRRVSLLVGASSSASQRSALAGAVAWSLELLPAWEVSALAQAATFRGGFNDDAAAAVIDLSAHADAPTVADALESLLEKSLLRVNDLNARAQRAAMVAPERRLEMPGVVREFSDARLDADGMRDGLARRHSSYFLRVAGGWAEGVDGHGGLGFRRRLEMEAENLLAVARRALLADPCTLVSVTTALRATLALEPVLLVRGPIEVFVDLLDRAVEPAEATGVPLGLRARCHEARARAYRALRQLRLSLQDLELALSLSRRARDRLQEGRALANLGTHHVLVGHFDAAQSQYRDALIIVREAGDRRVEGRALGHFGWLEHLRGHFDDAISYYGDALLIHQEVGDRRWEGNHTALLGAAHLEIADQSDRHLVTARTHLKRGVAIHRELGNRRFEAQALIWQGDLCAIEREREDAKDAWERAHVLARQVGDPRVELLALARTGALAARLGDRAIADELFLRARQLAQQAEEAALSDVVKICERRATQQAWTGEPERCAARVVRALG